jgi:tetratricopeptide (TPR) repeat protein
VAERAAPLLHGPEQSAWLDRLEAEQDNLRAALTWIGEHGSADDGLRLAVALSPYWEVRGYLSEGRQRLGVALDASLRGGAPPALRMEALLSDGVLTTWQGDLERAEVLLIEALASSQDLGDRRAEALARIWLTTTYRRMGETQRALSFGEDSLRLSHESGDAALIAWALLQYGIALRDADQADRAMLILDESLRRHRELGDSRCSAIASTMLGWAALEAGESARAARCLRDGAIELHAVGDLGFIVFALRGLAYVSQAMGESRRAATVFGAAEALRTTLGMSQPSRNLARDRVFVAALQEQMAPSEFDEAYARGEAMNLDELLASVVTGE